MNEIVIVGDVHEGKTYDFRVDPLTSVSARTWDLHANLVRAAKHAIEIRASIFVLLGDLFDRTNVAPIFREQVRQDVIEPLGKFGIKIIILAGNHDQPRVFQRGTSIDDFSGYSHVRIFRKPASIIETIGERKINFIIMPFLHSDTILDQAGKSVQEIPEDQRAVLGQEILKQLLVKYAQSETCDARVLLAHYYFEGAELSNRQNPEMDVGELEFKQSMLPEDLDIAVFGHVHLFQTRTVRNTPVVFLGAVERIDWGERKGDKNFMVLDPISMKWTLQQFPTRDMLEVRVKIDANNNNPTKTILENIPSNLEGKMVRLLIELPAGMRQMIQENKIAEKLAPAFNYKTQWIVPATAPLRPAEAAKALVDPYGLLESYVDLNFAKHPHRDTIVEEGNAILKEVLEE
ncbi:MAG: metallophosphoesterase [Thaumarchaeota archaeon]|nr:metallophosphoesterase [Nitrososphaerota archaeon]